MHDIRATCVYEITVKQHLFVAQGTDVFKKNKKKSKVRTIKIFENIDRATCVCETRMLPASAFFFFLEICDLDN